MNLVVGPRGPGRPLGLRSPRRIRQQTDRDQRLPMWHDLWTAACQAIDD
ncbi:hypothetical protein [Actinacidiphila glaucinigra]